MLLTQEQRGELARRHGVWVREACDRCGKAIVQSFTWTRQGEPGVYCLQVCRDGVARTAGKCEYCGADLEGKRRGARFCGKKCRMRFVRSSSPVADTAEVADGPNIGNAALAESSTSEPQNRGLAISVSPCAPGAVLAALGH